jgi:Flp pilus assembly protein TadG
MFMMRLLARLARFGRDRRGVSAIEFALVAPLMVALYLGCVELSDGIAVDRKVSLTAAALANLTSESTALTSGDMTNIFNAASAIIQPYSASNMKMTVSCLSIDASKNVTTKWTATSNGGVGTAASVPTDLQVASTQLILAQVSYAYKPIVGYTISGTLTLTDKMYMMPRISAPSYPDTNTKCGT